LLKESIYKLETSLLSPKIRHSKEILEKLISDKFIEIGKSGIIYCKTELIEALINESDKTSIIIENFEISQLSKEVILSTYKSVNRKDNTSTLRSSIWVLEGEDWRIRFHQGTLSFML